jgi:hypothetical protein
MFLNCSSLEINYVNGNVTNNTINGAYVLFKNNLVEYLLKHREFTLLNTSAVTSLDNLFKGDICFNEDISGWDTKNVVSMKSTFQGATEFNQPIGVWDMSNVTSINSLFLGATKFNSPVNNWDVTNVIDASGAFMNAYSFNKNIYNWKMTSCIDFTNMFNGCISLQASNLTLDISTNFETNNNFYMQLLID